MLENKKIRSILSLLLILNFILIIMCLVRIRFSYTGALEYTNTVSNDYKNLYTMKINSDIIGGINLGNKTFLLNQTDNNNYYLYHIRKFLYIQTCNESANGNIILVEKKV